MTPLAQYIARQQTLPKKDREYLVDGGTLSDWHCFDCTQVLEMGAVLAEKMVEDMRIGMSTLSARLCFLPAEKTWIEWYNSDAAWSAHRTISTGTATAEVNKERRTGYLLSDDGDGYASVFGPAFAGDGTREIVHLFRLPIGRDVNGRVDIHPMLDENNETYDDRASGIPGYRHFEEDGRVWKTTWDCFLIYAFLAMINTPRVVGRRQHMPHAGLQRKLAKSFGMVGKFPLRAWTEILLDVRPPQIDGGADHEARLSGRKALHFCRSHLRIKMGRLELVRAHWRGDPALGIKRSRYKVVA